MTHWWGAAGPRVRGAVSAAGALVVLVAALLVGMVIGRGSATVAAVPTVAAPTVIVQEPDALPLPVVGVEPSAQGPPAVLTADPGLPNERGRATGYRVVDTDIDRRALAEALAQVFGVEGEVVAEANGDWRVGPADGRTLVVTGDRAASWLFTDPTVGALGRVPAREAALDAAKALLGDLGVDVSGVDWQVDAAAPRTTVIAWQTINDQRTQLSWRVSIGRRGAITAASGFAGTLEPVPGYPVLGAAEAILRSARPGWSAFGPTRISDGLEEATGPDAPSSTFDATSPTLLGRPVAVASVLELVATEAVLGLAEFRQPSGEVLVLPAYELTAADGSRWSLLAIADAYLSLKPPPPQAPPAPQAVSSGIRSN